MDELLQDLEDRKDPRNHRKVFVFSDGYGHFWTKLKKPSDLTSEEKEHLVHVEK